MEERIIEFMIEDKANNKLVDLSLKDFSYETASESPAPGGGSISAYCGAMGADNIRLELELPIESV